MVWLPRPVPPSSLASSPITELGGTKPGIEGAPGSLAEVQPGATPGPLISIHSWGCSGLDPPCCTALGKLPHLPGVPKGLHKLILGKPQAEGRSLSRLGLYGQLSKPQPPQLQRPRRMTLFLALDPARLCSHSGSLSGHAALARHRSSMSL